MNDREIAEDYLEWEWDIVNKVSYEMAVHKLQEVISKARQEGYEKGFEDGIQKNKSV